MSQPLIRRLQQGILATEDYAEVAKSRASLKVRIHRLRGRGFTIRSLVQDDFHTGRGRPSVAYQLIAMPPQACCARCGAAL